MIESTTVAARESGEHPLPVNLWQLGLIAVCGMSLRFTLAWLSHGEPVVDVFTFWQWAKNLDAGINPYTAESAANYPPLWLYLCWLCLKAAESTGLSFDLMVKLFVGAVDGLTVAAVGLLAAAGGTGPRRAQLAAVCYAINPVTLMIASLHAQNDPVVMGLVVWASWLVVARPCPIATELAMAALGLSLAIKPIGLLFAPLLLWRCASSRECCRGVAVLAATAGVCMLPYLVTSPVLLIQAGSTYRGPTDLGYLGIFNSWCNLGLGSSGVPIVERSPAWMRPLAVAVMALAAWRFRREALASQAVGVVLTLYVVYGSLGAQYLMWFVPLAAASRSPQLTRTSLATAVALLAFYQLHHPGILTGEGGKGIHLGVTIPQWSGVFLFAQVLMYVGWVRWLMDMLRRGAGFQPAVVGQANSSQLTGV